MVLIFRSGPPENRVPLGVSSCRHQGRTDTVHQSFVTALSNPVAVRPGTSVLSHSQDLQNPISGCFRDTNKVVFARK